MTALINSGVKWMKPLLLFRNRLVENRNISENRNTTRRNGQIAIDDTGHCMGNYTIAYRIQLLRELLTIQKETQQHRSSINLITSQELIAIQIMWYRDGYFSTTVNDIYNEVYGYDLVNDDIGLQERILLEKSCINPNHYSLIQELLALQRNKTLLVKKHGLQNDIETRLGVFITEHEL
jgi:DNA sulfur modification protein DndC